MLLHGQFFWAIMGILMRGNETEWCRSAQNTRPLEAQQIQS
jgi:hypothetical protein